MPKAGSGGVKSPIAERLKNTREDGGGRFFTQNAHQHRRLSGGDLLQEGQDLVYHEPLVEIFQNLPQTDQRVHPNLHSHEGGREEGEEKLSVGES